LKGRLRKDEYLTNVLQMVKDEPDYTRGYHDNMVEE
jgi:hypothetical protein